MMAASLTRGVAHSYSDPLRYFESLVRTTLKWILTLLYLKKPAR